MPSTDAAAAPAGSMNMVSIIMLLGLIVVMYFLMIRPQRKREKEINEMRNGVRVGDDVITIGGICGKIVKTKEDVLTIQVGADKTKFEVMRWAISKVVSESTEPVKSSKREEEDEEPQKSMPKRLKPKSSEGDAEAADNDGDGEEDGSKKDSKKDSE